MKMTDPNRSFSHIKDMDDLKTEIRRLKLSVKKREADFGERIKQLPQETIKATVGSIIPAFLNNSVAGSTLQFINALRKLIFSRRKTEILKEEAISGAKKIGVLAVISGLAALLKKKKTKAAKSNDTVK